MQHCNFAMKGILLSVSLFITALAAAQDYKWLHNIKNQKGAIQLFEEGAVVITINGNDSKRYTTTQLPDTWKQNGLQVTFTGRVGEIPPHIRMIGTPLQLKCIHVSKTDAKKLGIKKTTIKFK